MDSILEEVRLSYVSDPFGHVQGWRFSLCDWLADAGVSPEGFRRVGSSEPTYEYEYLCDICPSIGQAQYALRILDRAREIIRAEGLDY